MRPRADLQGVLRRRAATPRDVQRIEAPAQQPCACFTGDWAKVMPNCGREDCTRCGGWRPTYR